MKKLIAINRSQSLYQSRNIMNRSRKYLNRYYDKTQCVSCGKYHLGVCYAKPIQPPPLLECGCASESQHQKHYLYCSNCKLHGSYHNINHCPKEKHKQVNIKSCKKYNFTFEKSTYFIDNQMTNSLYEYLIKSIKKGEPYLDIVFECCYIGKPNCYYFKVMKNNSYIKFDNLSLKTPIIGYFVIEYKKTSPFELTDEELDGKMCFTNNLTLEIRKLNSGYCYEIAHWKKIDG